MLDDASSDSPGSWAGVGSSRDSRASVKLCHAGWSPEDEWALGRFWRLRAGMSQGILPQAIAVEWGCSPLNTQVPAPLAV